MAARGVVSARVLPWLAFSWGACTFFPVGFAYAHLLLLLIFLSPGLGPRLVRLRTEQSLLWPMAALLGWTLLALAAGPWLEDTPTRLFHVVRVLLLLVVGMLLTRVEAAMALRGLLAGALLAALIVAVHHVWGLPPWTIWSSLLSSRQNFSSGNMIMMATAAGLCFHLGLRNDQGWIERWVAWAAALALAVTVAAHSVSRNAQLLLPIGLALAIFYHYRIWRAAWLSLALALAMFVAALNFSANAQARFFDMVDQLQRVVAVRDYSRGVGERWRMYDEAVRGMLKHPVLGTGLGSWLPNWRIVAQDSMGTLTPEQRVRHAEINNPHNDYLLAGMETGVPGLLATVWLVVAFLREGWRRRSTAGGVTVLLASALAVTALINAPLRDAALGMTLLWLLGASVAFGRTKDVHCECAR